MHILYVYEHWIRQKSAKVKNLTICYILKFDNLMVYLL